MGWCASPGVSWAVSRSSVVMALSEPINSSPWMVTERGCLATQGGALFDWRSSASRVQPVSNRSELGKGQERCNLVNGLETVLCPDRRILALHSPSAASSAMQPVRGLALYTAHLKLLMPCSKYMKMCALRGP
eukprot:1141970-Pelagomonas_calceolata.AAC.3